VPSRSATWTRNPCGNAVRRHGKPGRRRSDGVSARRFLCGAPRAPRPKTATRGSAAVSAGGTTCRGPAGAVQCFPACCFPTRARRSRAASSAIIPAPMKAGSSCGRGRGGPGEPGGDRPGRKRALRAPYTPRRAARCARAGPGRPTARPGRGPAPTRGPASRRPLPESVSVLVVPGQVLPCTGWHRALAVQCPLANRPARMSSIRSGAVGAQPRSRALRASVC
jgi:hypothetical protein